MAWREISVFETAVTGRHTVDDKDVGRPGWRVGHIKEVCRQASSSARVRPQSRHSTKATHECDWTPRP